jgi:HEPN domain-containing protein
MNCVYNEWLKAANDDLLLIEKIRNEKDLTHLSAFHSQQAIEKSLKALLEFNKKDIPKIHSLNKLFKICEKEVSVKDFDIVSTLDSLYIESRYPSSLGLLPYGKPTLDDANEFYLFAKMISTQVKKIIVNK